jgi:hypothetical protein
LSVAGRSPGPCDGAIWNPDSRGWLGGARERLVDPGVVLVVSIRSDGTPRLSPVEPFLLRGGLWLSIAAR